MRRTLRTILVGMLVFALTIDSATACHFFARCLSRCRPRVPVYHTYCVPTIPCDPCCGPYDGTTIVEPSYSEGMTESMISPDVTIVVEPEPATVHKPAELPSVPALMPEPDEAEAVLSTSEEAEPLPPSEPAELPDDLFGELPEARPAPAAAMPAQPLAPAEEESTPPANLEDDLFGPATDMPSEPAAEEAGLSPETEAEPVAPPEMSDDEMFAPAAEEPAGGDLFAPPSDNAEEAAPVEEQPADDLFGTPSDEASADDLFGPAADDQGVPAETPADEMRESAEEEAPAEEAPPADDDFDDLFGNSPAVLQQPGGLASTALRKWVDNTGRYSCHGRMTQLLDGHVRLLKDNGRTTTVPLYRLSQGDLEFVHRQASAQQAEVLSHTASTN